MQRRDLIAMLGGTAALGWPHWASAQPTPELPLVAVLWPSTPEFESDMDTALRHVLRDGSLVEGTNFAFAMRYANGEFDRVAPLVAELIALMPRVIVTAGDDAVLAVHRAAPTVPLVVANMGDPVALGLAESYARPGGTVTGSTLTAAGGAEALIGKRLGLLKELVPNLKRIGFIGIADVPTAVAGRLDLSVLPLPVQMLDDVEAAFASGLRAGVDAFYIQNLPLMLTNRARVGELATRAGKPTVGPQPQQARAGLLISYGSDFAYTWRRAGDYVTKILAGVKPGDLPFEQATKFTFVLNLNTARALGLTIPPTLLARADEVIE